MSTALNAASHLELESWALTYAPVAILGFVCSLLIIGKVVHFKGLRNHLFLGFLAIPPAVMSGLIGIAALASIQSVDSVLSEDVRQGLERLVTNFQSFMFSSLILGLHSASDSAQANQTFRGVLLSTLHEGLPMIIYSQILVWGQSCCCVIVLMVVNFVGLGAGSNAFLRYAALVPHGAETGADVLVGDKQVGDALVISEAESIGLVITCFAGIALLSARPYLQASGWMASSRMRGGGVAGSDQLRGDKGMHLVTTTTEEVFGRKVRTPVRMRSDSSNDLAAPSNSTPTSGHSPNAQSATASVADREKHKDKVIEAGLGAHISLIAFTAFLSFGITMLAHALEIKLWGNLGTVFTGFRMFKLSMFLSLVSMLLLKRWRVSFKREWFMLLSGLFLDFVIVSALSKCLRRPQDAAHTHYVLITVLVVTMAAWNAICYLVVARTIFPNFSFERAVVLSAAALGNCHSGLLFARLMDPSLKSPVPAAFGASLLLFFIPDSAAKNKIVLKFLSGYGLSVAFLIAFTVLCTWYLIFRNKFNYNANDSVSGTDGNETAAVADADYSPLLASSSSSVGDASKSPGGRALSRRLQALGAADDEGADGIAMGSSPSFSPADTSSSAPFASHFSTGAGHDSVGAGVHVDVKLVEGSNIVSTEMLHRIASWLPASQRSRCWDLRYSLIRDGASMSSLLSQCRQRRNSSGTEIIESHVLIVEDSMGSVFGAFMAHALQKSAAYYGSGENFVFRLSPDVEIYRWSKENHLFVLSDRTHLAIGGGDGFALQLDEDLDTGVSTSSATYRNPILSSGEFFRVLNVEVFALQLLDF